MCAEQLTYEMKAYDVQIFHIYPQDPQNIFHRYTKLPAGNAHQKIGFKL